MEQNQSLKDLWDAFTHSPQPALKITNYFPIYDEIFSQYRNQDCVFIEVGVKDGGSLFMWRRWLGQRARIIGVDLNPSVRKWEDYGFEIYIGDQGDPLFWDDLLTKLGGFDCLLDDGGHQSYQQVVTLTSALKHAGRDCVIAIEDTCTSFLREFQAHGKFSFLNYTKQSTDNLLNRTSNFFPGQYPPIINTESDALFNNVHKVTFYSGLISYHVRSDLGSDHT